MDRSSPPPLGHEDHKRHEGHRLITLRDPDGSSTPPFHCVYHLALADDPTVLLLDVPMKFHKQVVVEWLDGTRLPESACTPEGLALLSSVMRVLAFLGADALVNGIARELAEAVQERNVKMKDALAACNHEVAFTRALADLYDRPLPRFQLTPLDTQPRHFVAALVKPGGVVERVEVAHVNATISIARLLYVGPVIEPCYEMVLPAFRLGFREVLRLDKACKFTRHVNGTLDVYFDKGRHNPDEGVPASFLHPNVVSGSVVCVLRWYHTRLQEPWLRCDGFASLPEPWIRDELWRVLGKWIAGGHEVLSEDIGVVHGDIHDTLMRLTDVQTALRHATRVSYGSYDVKKKVKEFKEFNDT
jgi:hypothetical protein